MEPLTQEEANSFNRIVATLDLTEKDQVLKQLKETIGSERDEYIRSVINSKQ